MSLVRAVEDHLLAWVLAAVALGVAVPALGAITRASTLVLAVMVGSISLTLSVDQFRAVRPRTLAFVLAGHAAMPLLAYGVATGLGLAPPLVVGFVVLGAVTPELVTPVMTELAAGDTAFATTVLVATGVGSVAFVPLVVGALADGPSVPTTPIVEQLLVAVVAPMLAAVAARARWPARVARYDDYYAAVSATMVVVIIGGVTAANADVLRSNAALLASVVAGAVALNAAGYAVGYLVSAGAPRDTRVAAVLAVGMRDFAVAAALVVAAGLPAVAALPAVAFGVVEMTTSAGLAQWLGD